MLDDFFAKASLWMLALALAIAGLGIPLPEDPILLAAGALTHRTPTLSPATALIVVYLATIAGDVGLFLLARHFGKTLLTRRPLCWLATPARRQRVQRLLDRRGAQAIFVGRHVSGLRAVLFITAGIEGVRLRTFIMYDALAGLVSIPAMFGLGYFFSSHLARVEAGIAHVEHWLMAAGSILLLAFLLYYSLRKNTGR